MMRLIPDEVILGLLKSNPSHGYQLLERFRSKTQLGRVWTMSSSQLYAVLKRLEDDGSISGKRIEVKDAPSRVEYSITKLGGERLEAWLYDPKPPISIHQIRVMFLSRLYIALLLTMPVEKIITYQEEACKRQREKFIKEQQLVSAPIENLAVAFVISQLGSALDWIDQCKTDLAVIENHKQSGT